MTQIAMEAYTAIKGIRQELAQSNQINSQIDWEQRRYEIAKDMLCSLSGAISWNISASVKEAVEYADALIKELKR